MNTDKHKLLAALVRSFFDAFSSGVIDCAQGFIEERRQPKHVKRAMLDHYEQIAPAFFDTLFFPLATIHFSYEEMERVVREARQQGEDMMSLVRRACGSEAFYEALVAEYKRNFSALLEGACPSVADHLAACAKQQEGEGIDTDRAIELTVRVVMHAYARGLRVAGGQGCSLPPGHSLPSAPRRDERAAPRRRGRLLRLSGESHCHVCQGLRIGAAFLRNDCRDGSPAPRDHGLTPPVLQYKTVFWEWSDRGVCVFPIQQNLGCNILLNDFHYSQISYPISCVAPNIG